MLFQILGAIAEFEHALMSERTRGGLAASARKVSRDGAERLWLPMVVTGTDVLPLGAGSTWFAGLIPGCSRERDAGPPAGLRPGRSGE
jgi:hypothetical protein